tara:strand:- start:6731 stop:7051 length:321 start_codon:yes stop_codon:yes gene_type:complete
MVTFDLLNSKTRTKEYKQAEEALKFKFKPQNYWKPVKQCAIVRTDMGAQAIRDTLKQRLGANTNIMVVRIKREYALTIKDPAKRREAKGCFDQIPGTGGGDRLIAR